MPTLKPYITDKFTAYRVEEPPPSQPDNLLLLVVWLVDDYTKDQPVGDVKVKINQLRKTGVKNLSGYYFFTGLPDGNYQVSVESDLYFTTEQTVDLSTLDLKNPVLEILLKPGPAYPFPDHATLVRGFVGDSFGDAEVEVTVAATRPPIEFPKAKTNEKGEFVLYFQGIKTENIIIKIHKNGNTKIANTTIKEGKTVSLGTDSFL